MADREHQALFRGAGDEVIAMGQLESHRLLKQHMLARIERRCRHLVMQNVGNRHIDEIDVITVEKFAVIAAHIGAWMGVPCRGLAGLGLDRNGGELGARRRLDRGGMMRPEKTIANETETNRVRPTHSGSSSSLVSRANSTMTTPTR